MRARWCPAASGITASRTWEALSLCRAALVAGVHWLICGSASGLGALLGTGLGCGLDGCRVGCWHSGYDGCGHGCGGLRGRTGDALSDLNGGCRNDCCNGRGNLGCGSRCGLGDIGSNGCRCGWRDGCCHSGDACCGNREGIGGCRCDVGRCFRSGLGKLFHGGCQSLAALFRGGLQSLLLGGSEGASRCCGSRCWWRRALERGGWNCRLHGSS